MIIKVSELLNSVFSVYKFYDPFQDFLIHLKTIDLKKIKKMKIKISDLYIERLL